MKTLKKISELFAEVNKTNGRLEKEKTLSTSKLVDEEIRSVLNLVLSPYTNFGVTKTGYIKYISQNEKKKTTTKINLIDLLNKLSNSEVVGNAACDLISDFLNQDERSEDIPSTTNDYITPKDVENFYLLLDKKTSMGVSSITLNKCGFNIPNFDVSLAENYFEKEKNIDLGEYLLERKLDGLRCVVKTENGVVKFYSREGKQFVVLNELQEQVKKINNSGNYVFDGEITICDDSDLEYFELTKSLVNSSKNLNLTLIKHGIVSENKNSIPLKFKIKNKEYKLIYKLFDVLTVDEFEKGTSAIKYTERIARIDGSENIEVLSYKIPTKENLKDIPDGWEGFILRKNTFYKSGRSSDILKVKKFKEIDLFVIDLEQSTKPMLNEEGIKTTVNCVGNLICKIAKEEFSKELTYDGKQLNEDDFGLISVGSGISDDARVEWFKNEEKIIDKTINVKYFEITKNSTTGELSLRFPTFVRVK
jgi:ATP-dependent DNA ligase